MAERITLARTYDIIRHTLGGGLIDSVPPKMIADLAGEHLFSMHQWAFAKQRQALLDLRGTISLTDATWTESSLTLTSTGDFASYTFVSGDVIEITDGTGATTGFYGVASRTSDDAIVLSTSIGASADGESDIDATLRLPTVSLPSDFGSAISITSTDSVLYGPRFTSLERIAHSRSSQVDASSDWQYCVAVAFAGDPPVPLLEVWPDPSSNSTGAWSLFYRKGWDRNADDQDTLPIPEYAHGLYFEIAKAFARGFYEEDEMGLSERLVSVGMGPLARAAKLADGKTQTRYGQTQGGGAVVHSESYPRADRVSWLTSPVAPPS